MIPPNIIPPAVRAKLGPRDESAEALIDADGFSPLSPIVFQLPDPIDAERLPADGGNVVVVRDLTTGAKVPIRAEVSSFKTDERGARNIVLVWPRTKFEYGTRYFAGITRGVRTPSGALARPSGSLASVSAATRSASASNAPVPWSSYLTATSFMTRSKASIVSDVIRMASVVRKTDHPVRGLHIGPTVVGGAALVTGQVSISDFRSADKVISRDGSAKPTPRWIDFMMTMPAQPASAKGAPVVVYGHGLSTTKETMLIVAGQNAAKGYATIAIDMPNHGTRTLDGGYLFDITNAGSLGRLESMPLQGELDQISLLSAIQRHLKSMDLMPLGSAGGDGVPDLDTSHLLFMGTSLGGFLGASVAAIAPEVDGVFLQVAGSGIMPTLFGSILWEALKSVVPSNAAYGEAHLLMSMAQGLLDRSDNSFYLDRLVQRKTPFFLVYAIDDGVVPNENSERMIGLMRLRMTGRQYGPIWPALTSSKVATMQPGGSGFAQVPTTELNGSIAKPLLTHVEFVDPLSVATLDRWLDQRSATFFGK